MVYRPAHPGTTTTHRPSSRKAQETKDRTCHRTHPHDARPAHPVPVNRGFHGFRDKPRKAEMPAVPGLYHDLLRSPNGPCRVPYHPRSPRPVLRHISRLRVDRSLRNALHAQARCPLFSTVPVCRTIHPSSSTMQGIRLKARTCQAPYLPRHHRGRRNRQSRLLVPSLTFPCPTLQVKRLDSRRRGEVSGLARHRPQGEETHRSIQMPHSSRRSPKKALARVRMGLMLRVLQSPKAGARNRQNPARPIKIDSSKIQSPKRRASDHRMMMVMKANL